MSLMLCRISRRNGEAMKIQKNGRKRGNAGNGNGCHHAVSPMGHGTHTKSRKELRRAADRKLKQGGWN